MPIRYPLTTGASVPPARPVTTVVWYLNDVVQGVRDFEDVDEAREWAVNTLWVALPMGHTGQ